MKCKTALRIAYSDQKVVCMSIKQGHIFSWINSISNCPFSTSFINLLLKWFDLFQCFEIRLKLLVFQKPSNQWFSNFQQREENIKPKKLDHKITIKTNELVGVKNGNLISVCCFTEERWNIKENLTSLIFLIVATSMEWILNILFTWHIFLCN